VEQVIHKKIKFYSYLGMILFTVPSILTVSLLSAGIINPGFSIIEVIIVWLVFMIFPLASIVTSYIVLHSEKTWIRKYARVILYTSPIVYAAGIFLINTDIMPISITGIIINVLLTYVVLLNLFVFSRPESLASTIIFISLLIVGIVFKRFHLPLAGTMLVIPLAFYSVGSYLFGIRCLYYVNTNRFLRLTVFFGGCIVALFFSGMLFKFQHWPGHPVMIPASLFLLVAGTILVLLALPSSGYFEWQEKHRRILKRMILPWGLMFLLFILRFLLPEVDAVIWTKDDSGVYPGFEMYDYELPPGDENLVR
jgi:hypothetical protein